MKSTLFAGMFATLVLSAALVAAVITFNEPDNGDTPWIGSTCQVFDDGVLIQEINDTCVTTSFAHVLNESFYDAASETCLVNVYVEPLSGDIECAQTGDKYVYPFVFGDMNCDGGINNSDVNPFVLAIFNKANYESTYPDCYHLLADTSQDGFIDLGDIPSFQDLLPD